MVMSVNDLDDDHLVQAAKTSMSSKIIGKEMDFFSKLAVDAVKSVKMKATTADLLGMGEGSAPAASSASSKKERFKYPLSAIHILKAHGQSSIESHLIDGGFAINATRAAQGMPTA
eukprot:567466-Ditylum_brightwellii.AAC.1